jgi:hypothetical protein
MPLFKNMEIVIILIYKTLIQPKLPYSTELWTTTTEERRLISAKTCFMRTAGYILLDHMRELRISQIT